MTTGASSVEEPVATVELTTAGADETRRLGHRLARLLRAGDVVVLSGGLGAGKTTLAQGIGAGLGVRGDVTSPTFVISRVHPTLVGGPSLVHVDAFRLHDGAELEDLDLDETLETSVTVVEWGDGLADRLSPDRLRVHLRRQIPDLGTPGAAPAAADPGPGVGHDLRLVSVEAFGSRWSGVTLGESLGAPG